MGTGLPFRMFSSVSYEGIDVSGLPFCYLVRCGVGCFVLVVLLCSNSLGAWFTMMWGDAVVWGRQSIHLVPPCPLPRALGSCLWVPFAMSGSLCVVPLSFLPSGMGSFSPTFPEVCLSVGLDIFPGWQVLWVRVAVVSFSPRDAESASLLLFSVAS